MKNIKTISFVVLMLIVISATAVAQSRTSFYMNSYGRGSRNFSFGFSNFGGLGRHGYNNFYGSYSNGYGGYGYGGLGYNPRSFGIGGLGYDPRSFGVGGLGYDPRSFGVGGYGYGGSNVGCYVVSRPVVISRPTARIITQPVVIVQNSKSNQEVKDRKERFLQMLKGEKEERIKAIENLAGFSFDKKVEIALIQILLTDPDPEVRHAVAESLGKTNNKAFLVALEAAKKDTDDGVSQEADASIRKLK